MSDASGHRAITLRQGSTPSAGGGGRRGAGRTISRLPRPRVSMREGMPHGCSPELHALDSVAGGVLAPNSRDDARSLMTPTEITAGGPNGLFVADPAQKNCGSAKILRGSRNPFRRDEDAVFRPQRGFERIALMRFEAVRTVKGSSIGKGQAQPEGNPSTPTYAGADQNRGSRPSVYPCFPRPSYCKDSAASAEYAKPPQSTKEGFNPREPFLQPRRPPPQHFLHHGQADSRT
jgi:hypothetical protein